jgi:hypothetical protein
MQSGNFSQGDFNYDGVVNTADLTIYALKALMPGLPEPSAFNVWSYSDSQINLSWDDAAVGEDGYWIQWSDDGRSFTKAAGRR